MRRTDQTICFLCEAGCGIRVEHDGHEVFSVRPDPEDPFSRGHICPKAAAIGDLHSDPDRLTAPLRREGTTWRTISYIEALDEAAARIAAIQLQHGDDALAFYRGNPANHNYATTMLSTSFYKALRTKNRFSSRSLDSLPRLLASSLIYGAQTTLPVPDLDRTSFLLILGANPLVSNGSIMTAPGMSKRIEAIRKRAGKVVRCRRAAGGECQPHHRRRRGRPRERDHELLRTPGRRHRGRSGRGAGRMRERGPWARELSLPEAVAFVEQVREAAGRQRIGQSS